MVGYGNYVFIAQDSASPRGTGESPVFVNLPVLMVDPSSLHFHMPVALSEFWLYVDNLVSSPHLRTDAASSQIHE